MIAPRSIWKVDIDDVLGLMSQEAQKQFLISHLDLVPDDELIDAVLSRNILPSQIDPDWHCCPQCPMPLDTVI